MQHVTSNEAHYAMSLHLQSEALFNVVSFFQMMYETEKFRIFLIANEGWVPILASLDCSSLGVREAAVAAILSISESEQSHSKLVQGGAIAW